MLGIISAAGNALRAFGSVHPAIKWGVIVLAGLLAVEVVGREGIALYRDMVQTPLQNDQVKQQDFASRPQNYPVPTLGDMEAFKKAIKDAPDPKPDNP